MESRGAVAGDVTDHCVVIGCNGQFGRIMTGKLANEGVAVSGVDLQETPQASLQLREYVRGDIREASQGVLRLVRDSQCVLLCIPEKTVIEAIPLLRESVTPGGLVVDIASVKTRIADALRASSLTGAYLSIHPMFGPLPDFGGRNVCVVPYGENARSRWFMAMLSRWGARVSTLSAQEHDQLVAYTQALPHAVLLGFAAAVTAMPGIYGRTSHLATPIYKVMLALVGRIVSNESSLYWNIQFDNPYATKARRQLLQSIEGLHNAVGEGQSAHLAKVFDATSSALGIDSTQLRDLATRIVDLVKD